MTWKPIAADFEPVVKQCLGCKKIIIDNDLEREDKRRCVVYINPKNRWKTGICPVFTEKEIITEKTQGKKRAGQQKQKKH